MVTFFLCRPPALRHDGHFRQPSIAELLQWRLQSVLECPEDVPHPDIVGQIASFEVVRVTIRRATPTGSRPRNCPTTPSTPSRARCAITCKQRGRFRETRVASWPTDGGTPGRWRGGPTIAPNVIEVAEAALDPRHDFGGVRSCGREAAANGCPRHQPRADRRR